MQQFFIFRVFATIALSLACVCVNAQAWPTKNIRIVLQFSPGGATDVVARILAQHLTTSLGQTVIVENKPGAAGMIAANTVAKSSPDAYTLLITDDGVLISMPQIQKNIPYDPLNDLLPIGMVCMFPYVIVTNPKTRLMSHFGRTRR